MCYKHTIFEQYFLCLKKEDNSLRFWSYSTQKLLFNVSISTKQILDTSKAMYEKDIFLMEAPPNVIYVTFRCTSNYRV